jgi:hypothetical protein
MLGLLAFCLPAMAMSDAQQERQPPQSAFSSTEPNSTLLDIASPIITTPSHSRWVEPFEENLPTAVSESVDPQALEDDIPDHQCVLLVARQLVITQYARVSQHPIESNTQIIPFVGFLAADICTQCPCGRYRRCQVSA